MAVPITHTNERGENSSGEAGRMVQVMVLTQGGRGA